MRKAERHSYIRRRADEMAGTGDFKDYMAIETQLRWDGYEEARTVLDNRTIRMVLDRRCAAAQARKGTNADRT